MTFKKRQGIGILFIPEKKKKKFFQECWDNYLTIMKLFTNFQTKQKILKIPFNQIIIFEFSKQFFWMNGPFILLSLVWAIKDRKTFLLNKNFFIFKINAFFTVRKQSSRTCTAAPDTEGKRKHQRKLKQTRLVFLLSVHFCGSSQTPGSTNCATPPFMDNIKWHNLVMIKTRLISEVFLPNKEQIRFALE